MKSYSWILILVLFLSGFSSCHSDSEKYKDILQEGSWYVYDIDYSYKLYDDSRRRNYSIFSIICWMRETCCFCREMS